MLYAIAIDSKYGKANPIYSESSRKKGEAILKLTHSTHKPLGYSDLSTNSRSSLNNTFIRKQKLDASKHSTSKQKLKRYATDSTVRSTKRKKSTIDINMLNKQATLLIERSIHKNRVESTPTRKITIDQKLDLSGANLTKKFDFKTNSNVRRIKPNAAPFPVRNMQIKRKFFANSPSSLQGNSIVLENSSRPALESNSFISPH
jgi:hypothetical protein